MSSSSLLANLEKPYSSDILTPFTEQIGKGRHGIVLMNPVNPTQVVKILNSEFTTVQEVINEAYFVELIYQTISTVLSNMSQTFLPKLLSFSTGPFEYNGVSYSGLIVMTRINPPPEFSQACRICLNYKPQGILSVMNLYRKHQKVNLGYHSAKFYDEYLPTLSTEQQGVITNAEALATACGFIWASIPLFAGLAPEDVEYVLGTSSEGQLVVSVIDFGRTIQFPLNSTTQDIVKLLSPPSNFNTQVEIPFPKGKIWVAWKAGVTKALACNSSSPYSVDSSSTLYNNIKQAISTVISNIENQ